jgi:hypothetical protein
VDVEASAGGPTRPAYPTSWPVDMVGVMHFGCLDNNYPAGVYHHYYYGVAAQNGSRTSAYVIVGQKCVV